MTLPAWLIVAKLRPPQESLHCIPRAAWARRFPALLDAAAVVVDAPAGFGKSTVLLQYLRHVEQAGHETAWLSLDEEQSDAADLLVHLAASLAIAGIAPAISTFEASLRAPGGSRDLHAFIHRHLSARPGRCYVFLDDVHRIGTGCGAEALSRLLEWLPPNTQLVMASRGTPPVSLASFRASGRLVEFGSADLVFDTAEAVALFAGALSKTQLEEALRRTEGWPFALQLMRLRRTQGALTPMHPAHLRDIAAYLAEEVFADLGAEMTEFLVTLSSVEQISGAVACALTDNASAPDLLAEAYRHSLFLIALDEAGEWYRFHHLFREFLLKRLQQRGAEQLRGLRRVAARALLAAGDLRQAARQALLTQDAAFCAQLLRDGGGWRMTLATGARIWDGFVFDGATLERFPSAAVVKAYQLAQAGQLQEARTIFESTRASTRDFTLLAEGEPPSLRMDARAVDLLLRTYEDRPVDRHQVVETEEWFREHAPAEPLAKAIVLELLGWSYFIVGDHRRTLAVSRQSLHPLQVAGADYLQIYALFGVGSAATVLGDYDTALDALRKAERLAVEKFGAQCDQARAGRALQGHVLCEQGQFEAGADLARDCIARLADSDTWSDLAFAVYSTLATSLVVSGRADEAHRLLSNGVRVLTQPRFQRFRMLLMLLHRQHGLGSLSSQAERFAAATDSLLSDPDSIARADWRSALLGASVVTRDALREQRHDEVRSGAALLSSLAERYDALDARIEAALAEGCAAAMAGDNGRALSRIGYSLEAARRVGHWRVPSEYAPFLARALSRDIRKMLQPSHAAMLGRLPGLEADAPSTPASQHPVLSPRERQVLALLIDGLTSKQIAQSLGISINTAMDYRKTLYRKINAYSRADAVAFARENGLAPSRFIP